MDLYREAILDHYKNPRNFGHLDKPDVVAEEGNVTCGDKIIIELRINASTHQRITHISDVRFSGEGCAISQAAASMLTENVKGMSVAQVRKLSLGYIQDMLGTTLTPSRVKCATLSLEVLQKAVSSI